MTPSEVSAVIVTKGDRDIREVPASLEGFGEVIVRDNSKSLPDWKVFGRWMGAMDAQFSVVAVCDDDVIVDWPALCAQYRPGKLVCNMPEEFRHGPYSQGGISLVG